MKKNQMGFFTAWLAMWTFTTALFTTALSKGGLEPWLAVAAMAFFEIIVFRMGMRHSVEVARSRFRPPVLKVGLDSMSATWKHKPHIWGILLWCFLLGLMVLTMLLIGTWLPARWEVEGSWIVAVSQFIMPDARIEPSGMLVPLLLTGLWSTIVWSWGLAMRDIVRSAGRFSLVSTLSRLTIQHQGLLRRRNIELQLDGLRVTSDDTTIRLHTEDDAFLLSCPAGLARDQLLENLQQSIERAEQDPFSQPELPQPLAEMLGQKS